MNSLSFSWKEILLSFLIFIICGCNSKNGYSKKSGSSQKNAYEDVLPVLLKNTSDTLGINNYVDIELYPDRVKEISVNHVLEFYKERDKKYYRMLLGLKGIINDSIKVKSFHKENINFYSSTNEVDIEKIRFAQINLSKVYFESPSFGVFYFAIQCGSDCGNGYFVFVKQVNIEDKWKIDGIGRIW